MEETGLSESKGEIQMIRKPKQMSESMILGVVLTLAGGFQDAYSYNCRGQVFANAQTGNIVLLGQNIASGNFQNALHYLFPLLAFLAGVYLSEWVRELCKSFQKLHWRQIVLAFEIVMLAIAGLLPQSLNVVSNVLMSFACAMQVDSFRKFRGIPCATTMCIGNLRSGTQYLYDWLKYRDPVVLSRALQYFGTIVLFGAGAAAGSLMTMQFGMWVIWVSSALLSVSFLLMFWKTDEKELQAVGRKLERELCTVEEKAEHKLEHLEEKHR